MAQHSKKSAKQATAAYRAAVEAQNAAWRSPANRAAREAAIMATDALSADYHAGRISRLEAADRLLAMGLDPRDVWTL